MSKEAADLSQVAGDYKEKIISGWEKLYKLKRKKLQDTLATYFDGDSVLEMGVADGEMTQHLISKFKDYTILDGSEQHLQETVDRVDTSSLENFEAVHSYFEDYRPNRKYDNILMTHILEHLSDPVLVLKNAKSWLSEKGKIFIAVPNANSLHRHVGVKMGMLETPHSLNEQDITLGHLRIYYPDSLKRDVESAGLKVLHFGGQMVKPISNRQIEADWSDDLIEAFFALSDDFPEICSEMYIVAGN